MNLKPTRTACLAAIAVAPLLLAGCGQGASTPSSSGAPSSSVTSPAASPSAAASSQTPSAASSPTASPSASDAKEEQALNKLEADVAKDAGLDEKDSEPDYASYDRINREDFNFSIEAPTEWSVVQKKRGSKEILAAPDVKRFLNDYQTGVLVLRFDSKTAEEILTYERNASYPKCKAGEIRPYDDGRLKGFSQTFTNCQGSGSGAIVAVTSSQDDETFRGFFDTSFIDTRDVAALKRIISSLEYTKL